MNAPRIAENEQRMTRHQAIQSIPIYVRIIASFLTRHREQGENYPQYHRIAIRYISLLSTIEQDLPMRRVGRIGRSLYSILTHIQRFRAMLRRQRPQQEDQRQRRRRRQQQGQQ